MTRKAQRPAVVAPQTPEELNDFVRQLGALQRQHDTINSELNEHIAELTAQTTERLGPVVTQAGVLFDGIVAYTSAHRAELTGGGTTKTVPLPAGTCAWRLSPPKVQLTRPEAEVVAAIKTLGLTQFVRTKEELDREQVLKESELAQTVSGLTISQVETFTVRPHEVTADITQQSLKSARANVTAQGTGHVKAAHAGVSPSVTQLSLPLAEADEPISLLHRPAVAPPRRRPKKKSG